jgi:hypothetical protein
VISSFKRQLIAVLAVSFRATTAPAREDRGTPAIRLRARRVQALRQLHSRRRRVEQCLGQHKSRLNEACRLVFEQSAGPRASRTKQ